MDAVRPAIRTHVGDPPIRHTLAGGHIGVGGPWEYVRTAVDLVVWAGIVPLAARLLARGGARLGAMRVQRWWAGQMVRTLGIRIDWEGLDQIDPDEAYVVVATHEGFTDVLALLRLPLPLRFAGRDELAGWPLLGPYLRDTGQVIIRPEAGVAAYRRLVREGREVVGRGESLVIFPQGTILGIETDCLPGAFALALALDRPILPVALTGGHRVWEHPFGSRLRRGERMSVRVLPPIPAGEVRARGMRQIRRDVCRGLKSAALDGIMAPPRRFVPARDGYWDGYAFEIDPAFPDLAAEFVSRRRAGQRDRRAPGH
ncbi:MAG: 1-acyl-sn-glycerol-3-phosphate acyltransferase [uncultured Thermomicrobiales bacterium]|uniref:1-acyl-sn-glycerol-3-phosphate acyltransferase n=1 Tax=uncultured Thermomicrobiales bacterium TaxID=1645740 RepID=A0A6J4U9U2_9BACT|nr:MAG: 1-acyl-sn-glycerol-3-phosphate acyltransferase [uncultured Thermomicrobiales bacterium]